MPLSISINGRPYITTENSQMRYKSLSRSRTDIKVQYSVGSWYIMAHWLTLCCLLFSSRRQSSWRFLKRLMGQETDLTSGHAATVVSVRPACRDQSTLLGYRAESVPFMPLSFSDSSRLWHRQESVSWRKVGVHSRQFQCSESNSLHAVFCVLRPTGLAIKRLRSCLQPFCEWAFAPVTQIRSENLTSCTLLCATSEMPESGGQWRQAERVGHIKSF